MSSEKLRRARIIVNGDATTIRTLYQAFEADDRIGAILRDYSTGDGRTSRIINQPSVRADGEGRFIPDDHNPFAPLQGEAGPFLAFEVARSEGADGSGWWFLKTMPGEEDNERIGQYVDALANASAGPAQQRSGKADLMLLAMNPAVSIYHIAKTLQTAVQRLPIQPSTTSTTTVANWNVPNTTFPTATASGIPDLLPGFGYSIGKSRYESRRRSRSRSRARYRRSVSRSRSRSRTRRRPRRRSTKSPSRRRR